MRRSDFDARIREISQRYPNVQGVKAMPEKHKAEQDILLQEVPLGLEQLMTELVEMIQRGIPTPIGTRRLTVGDIELEIRKWIETEQADIDARRQQAHIQQFNQFVGYNAYEFLPPSVRSEIAMKMMWHSELGQNLTQAQEGSK